MAKEIRQKKFLTMVLIFLFSYLLNFLWESFHAIFLFTCCQNMDAPSFVRLISYASFIDALAISIMYITVSLFSGFSWINKPNKKDLLIFSILGLIIAIWIEYRGVYLLHKWSYSYLMPKILGIGLSPLVQLVVTGLITLQIVRRIR